MEKPKEITICNLEVLVMPNGEILCLGKTVGWFDKLGKFLSEKPHEHNFIECDDLPATCACGKQEYEK